jgi:predicted DNA-binding protein (MmcQ/YjbR family)
VKKLDKIYTAKPAITLLTRLRKIIAKLPDTTETISWGHPTFKVGDKAFAIFERFKGELGLVVKVEPEHQSLFLKDPRFYLTPYIGKRGWVTLRMEGVPVDWKEVRGMIQASHQLITFGDKK